MKKILHLFILLFVICGCASVESVTAPTRQRLLKLSIGMDKGDALKLMGTRTMKVKTDILHSVVINNPYRSEILQGKDKTLEVYYYVTDDKYDDNIIRDNDLTPLVFGDGKLMGWGQNFVKDLIEKNAIKTTDSSEKSKSKSNSMGFGKKKKK